MRVWQQAMRLKRPILRKRASRADWTFWSSEGFLDLFGGADPTGWDALSWDESHIIETRGLVTKLHQCCASTHRAIDVSLDLKNQHGFSLDQIQHIETKVGRSAVDNLAYPEPVDEMQARFSMQYCLATALLQGGLSLSDFTSGAICRRFP